MRVNRLTADDAKLPRNLRRVLAGIRKPLRAEEHAILKARIDMEEHSPDSVRMSEEQRSTDPDVVRHALAEIAVEQSTEAAS